MVKRKRCCLLCRLLVVFLIVVVWPSWWREGEGGTVDATATAFVVGVGGRSRCSTTTTQYRHFRYARKMLRRCNRNNSNYNNVALTLMMISGRQKAAAVTTTDEKSAFTTTDTTTTTTTTFPIMNSLRENPLLSYPLYEEDDNAIATTVTTMYPIIKKSQQLQQQQGQQQSATSASVALSNLVAMVGCTYTLSSAMLYMLYHYEWFQTWRYFWPLLGFLYAVDGFTVASISTYLRKQGGLMLLPLLPPLTSRNNTLTAMVSIIGGIGLVIGGAYDAFMPVWMTGPNVLTAAGIGQDSAMILWIVTAMSAVIEIQQQRQQPKEEDTQKSTIFTFWKYVILLSQLYILSDSAFEEVTSYIPS